MSRITKIQWVMTRIGIHTDTLQFAQSLPFEERI